MTLKEIYDSQYIKYIREHKGALDYDDYDNQEVFNLIDQHLIDEIYEKEIAWQITRTRQASRVYLALTSPLTCKAALQIIQTHILYLRMSKTSSSSDNEIIDKLQELCDYIGDDHNGDHREHHEHRIINMIHDLIDLAQHKLQKLISALTALTE